LENYYGVIDKDWITFELFDIFNYNDSLSKTIVAHPLCQLITTIDGVEIYEYDCFWDREFNEKYYLYYNELGLLKTNYLFLKKGKTGMIIHDPYVKKLINRSKFIGNWHDGEEYLLNKIKEVEND
jgi:hypothetical protein